MTTQALKVQYSFDPENEYAKVSSYFKMTEIVGAQMVVRGGAEFYGDDTLASRPTAIYVTIGENGYRLFKDHYGAFVDAIYDAVFREKYGISDIVITDVSVRK